MSEFDLVVFGATGFTGERVARYLAQIQRDQSTNYKWAVAGRDVSKLANVVVKLGEINPICLKETKIIKADVKDQKSLNEMASKSRVILNCVGPYRFFGEPVVKACIENGCHYLDVCGEPEFTDRMVVDYHRAAERQGSLVVISCGFDSIPADLGVLYTTKQFEASRLSSSVDAPIVTQIQGYVRVFAPKGMVANYATWESAVHGFSNVKALISVRERLKNDKELSPAIKRPPGSLLKIKQYYFEKLLGRYAVLFPGADASVVRHTQRALTVLGEKRAFPSFGAYFTVSSLYYVYILAFFGFLLKILTKHKFGRWLLLKFPYFFSFGTFAHGGPSQKALDATSVQYDFIADGVLSSEEKKESNVRLHTRFSGPEPGYVLTPICIVQAALCILEEKEKILPKGGVFTPGAVFGPTSLENRLGSSGCRFEVIKGLSVVG